MSNKIYLAAGWQSHFKTGTWSAIVVQDDEFVIDSFSKIIKSEGVNGPRCELIGLDAVLGLAVEYSATSIISSSDYIIKGYNKRMHEQVHRDFRKSLNSDQLIPNADLWKSIFGKWSNEFTVKWERSGSSEWMDLVGKIVKK